MTSFQGEREDLMRRINSVRKEKDKVDFKQEYNTNTRTDIRSFQVFNSESEKNLV
jgi:hypothetical protein